ncbi:MAG: SCO family protein, partial [Phenylobacterium sp.]|nr:SCO family protein [Phenylobacterium sp.]
MSRRILALVAVLAIALAILTGLAVRRGVLGPAPQTVAVGGPFQLVDTSGRTVDQDVLKGKWSVVFFGFTHCPDICPTTLFEMGQVEPLLGADAAKVQTVFITVDPARDTVAQMKAYVANPAFPKRLVGLTGSQAQVDATARAYRVYYQKVGDGY